MDAQNAAESDQSKPVGAPSSPRRPAGESDSKFISPTALRALPSPEEQKHKSDDANADDALLTTHSGDAPADRDSDAETIVLPGKDGHSPSKARKVRHEDNSESDGEVSKFKLPRLDETEEKEAPAQPDAPGNYPADGAGKKRVASPGSLDKDRRSRNKEGGSSGLSLAPNSPTPNNPQQQKNHSHPHRHSQHHHRRRSDAGSASPSDSEKQYNHQKSSSSKALLRDKLKSGERLLSHKRKAPKAESDDETESRKVRRQRTTSVHLEGSRKSKEARSIPAKPHDHRTRSISPQQQQHRRSSSTQFPSHGSNGLAIKKKRLPPPLQSTDYQSDDSSGGGSPHPRSSKLRSLTTPVMADSNISPEKMGPHKKHLDAHGQTLLARACARGEYETAKQRLGERPEDLNVADYAGNTPIQIAAINGCEDIVKLLIEAGCNLDCVNYDKDTPLLDAVDNGHLGVVNLLLDTGVNPRKANVNGEEPLYRVSDDTNNADDIRAALIAARKRAGYLQWTSEDGNSHECLDVHDEHAPKGPRRSPAAAASESTGQRSGTVRSTKTRNDLLYMPLDDKTMRQAAGLGDEETVARILQVRERYDDPESMVAAARGGHDLVIQLLLGLGGANADPGPAPSLSSEFATPVLAAIGQENIKVIELLLEQQGFDPTRRFKGETYYEIARRRQGTNWKEEEQILKNAYEEYKRSRKDLAKTKSPGARRERERDREDKLSRRDDTKGPPKIHRRNHSSPSREGEVKKKGVTSKISSPREKKRSDSFVNRGDDESQKRALGRIKKDVSHVSDREASPAFPHKPQKARRIESDVTGMSSEGETAKPRRKLVSKGELSKERDRQKRTIRDPASPHDSRPDEAPDKVKLSEKYHDRTKALRRDESRDLSHGEGTTKRHRSSMMPDQPSDGDKDVVEGSVKRRRLDGESQPERRPNRLVSVDGRPRKPISSCDVSAKSSVAGSKKERDDGSKEGHDQRGPLHNSSVRTSTSGGEKSIHVKSEDIDVPMLDIERSDGIDKANTSRIESEEEELRKKSDSTEQEAKKEEERRRDAEEKKRKTEEEEARRREEDERRRKVEEEKKNLEEKEARLRQEQAERERREAEEVSRRQEEERKRLEEEKRMKEEEERKRHEEEERLRKEQLEREAAQEARRLREELRERERRERVHREEMERKRAAREAEQRRIREEAERSRLDKLPPLLRWLATCANPKTVAVADKFKFMLGVRYDTIRQEANGTPAGRELWLLNTHVALLLGEKDLGLSRYTAWEREPVSSLAKFSLWRTEWTRYTLISEKLWDLGRQLPGYYGDDDPSVISLDTKLRLKQAAWERFSAMEVFFVKVFDFLYTVPNVPHLRNVKLAVEYRELLESEEQAIGWKSARKWKKDPGVERFFGFAPRNKYYVNGELVGEDVPQLCQTSKTLLPEVRVPRRGLVRVFPDDPDYERLCLEQGLDHLVRGAQTPPAINGVHSSPSSQTASSAKPLVNGIHGHAAPKPTSDAVATEGTAPNGVDGSSA